MNVAWRIESGRELVTQVGKGKVALMKTEFEGNCYVCGKYGWKPNKCFKNKSEEERGNKKFGGK